MPDLVGNLEDWFPHVKAHVSLVYFILLKFENDKQITRHKVNTGIFYFIIRNDGKKTCLNCGLVWITYGVLHIQSKEKIVIIIQM